MVLTVTETSTGLVEAKISTVIRDVHKAWALSFTLELRSSRSASGSQDLPIPDTHVVGLEACLDWKSEDEGDSQVDVNQLLTYLRPFTMLRVVVLSIGSYEHLVRVMDDYHPDSLITNPEIDDGRRYVVVFRIQEKERKYLSNHESYKDWIGVNPATLALTGMLL